MIPPHSRISNASVHLKNKVQLQKTWCRNRLKIILTIVKALKRIRITVAIKKIT